MKSISAMMDMEMCIPMGMCTVCRGQKYSSSCVVSI